MSIRVFTSSELGFTLAKGRYSRLSGNSILARLNPDLMRCIVRAYMKSTVEEVMVEKEEDILERPVNGFSLYTNRTPTSSPHRIRFVIAVGEMSVHGQMYCFDFVKAWYDVIAFVCLTGPTQANDTPLRIMVRAHGNSFVTVDVGGVFVKHVDISDKDVFSAQIDLPTPHNGSVVLNWTATYPVDEETSE